MEREGPLYGYQFAERIADRTGGAWRPGAGAVYPALGALVDRRLARGRVEGRRRVYRITREGRALLRSVRQRMSWHGRTSPDVGLLWAEIAGHDDPGGFLVDRLGSLLERIEEYLAPTAPSKVDRGELRDRVLERLRQAEHRLGGRPDRVASGPPWAERRLGP